MAKKNSLVDWDGLRIVGSFSDCKTLGAARLFLRKPRLKGPSIWAGNVIDHQPVHASQDHGILFHILQGVILTRQMLVLA